MENVKANTPIRASDFNCIISNLKHLNIPLPSLSSSSNSSSFSDINCEQFELISSEENEINFLDIVIGEGYILKNSMCVKIREQELLNTEEGDLIVIDTTLSEIVARKDNIEDSDLLLGKIIDLNKRESEDSQLYYWSIGHGTSGGGGRTMPFDASIVSYTPDATEGQEPPPEATKQISIQGGLVMFDGFRAAEIPTKEAGENGLVMKDGYLMLKITGSNGMYGYKYEIVDTLPHEIVTIKEST